MADINGTVARDNLTGTPDADAISGRDGADTLFGGGGDDRLFGHSTADADPSTANIVATRVAADLSSPLFGASPPGEPDRLFLVEQHAGRIRILDLNTNTLLPGAFLDLADNSLARGNEQGLLGLAFHPDYAANGLFYINITNAAGDTEVWAYRRADANVADVDARRLILTIDQPFSNHNGGWMAFGPDGLLYIATGDGGSAGDPFNNARNIDTLLGKMLRIDVNGDAFPADGTRNYAIPAGNPFVGGPGADEIFAYGLRNPWRPSFDTATGDFYIADVGQNAREEVNWLAAGTGAGVNFGWDFREGFAPFSDLPPPGLTDPVLDYGRAAGPFGGISVTGGYVYRGDGGAQGLYFFGDFTSGNLWTVRVQDGAAQDFLNRNAQLAVDAGDVDLIASFALDGRGRLYLIGLDGDVHRLTPGATAGDAGDLINGGDGNDTVEGGIGGDTLIGDAGNDFMRGLADSDLLSGGGGGDDLNGNMGSDSVFGDDGGDTVLGGQSDDIVLGGDGDDPHVNGNRGADLVYGGTGNDTVFGGQDNDQVFGDEGNDWLSGDLGNDLLYGGPGADRFLIRPGGGLDWVGDFSSAAGDRVQLAPGTAFTLTTTGDGQVVIDLGNGAALGLAGVNMASLGADWLVQA